MVLFAEDLSSQNWQEDFFLKLTRLMIINKIDYINSCKNGNNGYLF